MSDIAWKISDNLILIMSIFLYTSIILGLFLSIVILPFTGKNGNRKLKPFMLRVLIFIVFLAICVGICYLTDYIFFVVLFCILAPLVFGLLSLAVSLFWKKRRTVGSILVSIIIILLACLALFSLLIAFLLSW